MSRKFCPSTAYWLFEVSLWKFLLYKVDFQLTKILINVTSAVRIIIQVWQFRFLIWVQHLLTHDWSHAHTLQGLGVCCRGGCRMHFCYLWPYRIQMKGLKELQDRFLGWKHFQASDGRCHGLVLNAALRSRTVRRDPSIICDSKKVIQEVEQFQWRGSMGRWLKSGPQFASVKPILNWANICSWT